MDPYRNLRKVQFWFSDGPSFAPLIMKMSLPNIKGHFTNCSFPTRQCSKLAPSLRGSQEILEIKFAKLLTNTVQCVPYRLLDTYAPKKKSSLNVSLNNYAHRLYFTKSDPRLYCNYTDFLSMI